MSKTPGIYVHLPFCDVRCSYCDFPLTTQISLSDRYHSALFQEIQNSPVPEQADTLYFGGGTPSLTPPEILMQIRQSFRLSPEAEITLEANPEHISTDILLAWRDIGINRLSVGVQSLNPGVLKSMLRLHSPETALDALHLCRKAGFSNLNVDLILGYPGEDTTSFLNGLTEIIGFGVEHLSLYMLELHENTLLARLCNRGSIQAADDDEIVEGYTAAVRLLKDSGFDHYEVSNFARNGFYSRHNLKYWTNTPYHAFGAGACSYRNRQRVQNLPSVKAYIEAIETRRSPILTKTEQDDVTIQKNALIFGLRKTAGVEIRRFESEFGISPLSLFGDSLQTFVETGLLEITDESVRLTFSGMLVSNEILAELV